MENKIFGRLKVIMDFGRDKYKRALWLCECSCGQEKIIPGNYLRSGDTKSCGCLQKEIAKKTMSTHKKSGSPLYIKWTSIISRCENIKGRSYKYYGGKGVKICKDWRCNFLDFEAFCLNKGWDIDKQIDRIDNNGDYCPENCRIITKIENIHNRGPQRNRSSKYKGVSLRKKNSWIVSICNNYKITYLGIYNNEIEAATIYDKKAEELFGENAWLNKKYFKEVLYYETKNI
jgi:hypothetical protein